MRRLFRGRHREHQPERLTLLRSERTGRVQQAYLPARVPVPRGYREVAVRQPVAA